jgi:hypothetical protein
MNVPRLFHELYGEKTTKKTLYGSLFVGFFATLFIGVVFWSSFGDIALWRTLLILFFTFDIFAGLVANFSEGTNKYYQQRPRLSRVFIVIHVHPILLTLLAGEPWLTGLYIYAFMLATATLTYAIQGPNKQTFFGFFLTLIGVALLLTYFQPLPTFLDIIFIAFNFKLIYGFSVNHYRNQA